MLLFFRSLHFTYAPSPLLLLLLLFLIYKYIETDVLKKQFSCHIWMNSAVEKPHAPFVPRSLSCAFRRKEKALLISILKHNFCFEIRASFHYIIYEHIITSTQTNFKNLWGKLHEEHEMGTWMHSNMCYVVYMGCMRYIFIDMCVYLTCPIISCTSRKREWIIREGDFIRGIFLIQVRGPWIKTALSLFTLYSRLTKLFFYILQMLSIRSKRIKWWWNAKTNQFLKREKVKERQKVNDENEYE